MMADLVVKATVLLAIGWCAAYALRSRAASTRHAVWAGLLAATLVLPLIVAFAPALELPLLSGKIDEPRAATHITPVRELAILTDVPRDGAPSRVQLDPPAVTADAAPSWTASLTATQVLFGAWLAVTLLFALRLAISHIQARALLAACGDASPRLTTAIEGVSRALEIRTPPVRVAAAGMMPAVIGLLRPSVVLPADADTWSDERLELVLRHECAHVRRRDTLMQAVANLATSAYWWHPLAWVAARQIVRERELACDDLVIASGTPAEQYAEHLIDIARSMKSSRQPALAALAMARTSQLEGRVISLLDGRPRGSKPSRAVAAGIGLAIAAGLAIAPIKLVARTAVVAPGATELDGTQATTASIATPPAAQAAATASAQTAPAAATTTAAAQPNPALDAALLKAMSDEDPDVRAMAAAVLAKSGAAPAQITGALIKALQDSSDDVRRAALAGLIKLQRDDVLPHLAQAMQDQSEDIRSIAIAGVAVLDHPDKRALLLQHAGDESEDVRALIALSLAAEYAGEVTAALIAMTRDASADVRGAALIALGSRKREGSAASIAHALKDPSEDVRAAAAIALGSIGDESSIEALTAAMSDPHADVRKAALAGIGAINGDVLGRTTVASTVAGTIAGTIHGTLWGGSGYVWAMPSQARQPEPQQPAQPRQLVEIIGHIKNPGEYTFEEGMTAGRLIALAGGFSERGTARGLKIRRTEDGRLIEVDATEKSALRPRDQVVVAQRRW